MHRPSNTGLEICPCCRRDFVSMVRCTRARDGGWWLVLRCGDCGTWHETFAPDDAVSGLVKALARGRRAVANMLRTLERERMRAQVETFAHALELDLIGADDF